MIYLSFVLSLGLAIAYVYLIFNLLDGWLATSDEKNESTYLPSQSVTVVVASYNEEENIASCLNSILDNDYPKHLFHIIIVNNGSTDRTKSILADYKQDNLLVLDYPYGYKKDALEHAYTFVNSDCILTTDADCIVSKTWVRSMMKPLHQKSTQFVLGPVKILNYRNLLERFQAMDMLALMGVTAGGLKSRLSFQANGANLAFSTPAYIKSIGRIPRKDIASGDDVFLLHAFLEKFPNGIYYQKSQNAIVGTKAINTWNGLIQQRKRWASKATQYSSLKDKGSAAFIFIFCFSILVNFLAAPLTGGATFFIGIFQLFIKGVIDYGFLTRINEFFAQKRLLKYFISSFFIFYLYILFAGFSGLLGLSYRWKGRHIKQ